jgi:XRCC1 N terminal domain
MEKPVQISTVDIGNDGSAFVEIQVSKLKRLFFIVTHAEAK